jgi:TolA-binding protein
MKDFDDILKNPLREAGNAGAPDEDAVLASVFARAQKYSDPLDAMLKQEIAPPLSVLESIEDRLMQRISAACGASLDAQIDGVLVAELVLPAGSLEAVEDKLIGRVAAAGKKSDRPPQRVVWPLFGIFGSSIFSRVAKAAVAVCAVLFAGVSLSLLLPGMREADLQTFMVQAYGSAFQPDLNIPVRSGASLECDRDGGFTLVSNAGSITVRDDASIQISRATTRTMEYRVFGAAPSGRLRGSGSVEFSVEKRKRSQRFTVVTPWYDIMVTGTRFLVENDYHGSFSTVLLEGSVKIESRFFGDTTLCAGQTLTIDPVRNTWIIGPSSPVNTLSASDARANQALCRLVVVSAPSGADVFINSAYRGATPFAAALPAGACSLSVFYEGRTPCDTVITLQTQPGTLDFSLAPLEPPALQAVPAGERSSAVTPKPQPARPGTPAPAPGITAQQAKSFLEKAQQSESTDWKLSLALYREIAASLSTPAQYRETALFSLGRLTADRLRDTAAAMNDFSTYVIQYPRGLFSGEALLRLAELERSRNPASAVEYFRTFIALCPDHPRRADAAYYTGLLFKQNGYNAEALQMFTIALAQANARDTLRTHELQRQIAILQAEKSTAQKQR